MKRKLLVILMSITLVITMMPLSAFASVDSSSAKEADPSPLQETDSAFSDEENGVNREFAKHEFDIPEENIVESVATNITDLEKDGEKAATIAASTGKMAMVYATKNVEVDTYMPSFPKDVVLCAEDNTEFNYTNSKNRFNIHGSVYGGTYHGNFIGGMGFWFTDDFEGKNGIIKRTFIDGFVADGVWVTNGSGGQIIDNVITCNQVNGIRIQDTGNLSRVEKNEVSYSIEQSGLDIDTIYPNQITRVDYVLNNSFCHNSGHGISTNTEDADKKVIPGASCQMIQVCGNEIGNNGTYSGCQGLWLEDNCKITEKLDNNDIHDNYCNGIGLGRGAEINLMSNNEVCRSGSSNLSIVGNSERLSKVNIGDNNKFYSSLTCPSISTRGPVSVSVTGRGNQISNAPRGCNEIYLGDSASFNVSGGLFIEPSSNEQPTFSFHNISTVKLKNTVITAKTPDWVSVYYDRTCNFEYSSCKIDGRISVNQKVDPLPSATNFSARALNSKTAQIEWDAAISRVAKADKYLIYRGTTPTGSWPLIDSTTSTSYKDETVTAGNKYYYMVLPAFKSGDSWVYGEYSSKDYAYPRINDITGFSAWASDAETTNVSWDEGLDKDAEYWIYRGYAPYGDWGPVYKKLSHGETSFTEKVGPNQKYYYMVREAVLGNDGKYYFGNYTKIDYAYPRLNIPTPSGFSAWSSGPGSCNLSWDVIDIPNVEAKVEYLVYRGLEPTGDWGSAIAVKQKYDNSYIDYHVKSGRKYYYMMRAKITINGKEIFTDYSNIDYAYPR